MQHQLRTRMQVMGDFYQTLRGVITGAAQLPSADAPSLLLDHKDLAAAKLDVIMVVLGDQVRRSTRPRWRTQQHLLRAAHNSSRNYVVLQ